MRSRSISKDRTKPEFFRLRSKSGRCVSKNRAKSELIRFGPAKTRSTSTIRVESELTRLRFFYPLTSRSIFKDRFIVGRDRLVSNLPLAKSTLSATRRLDQGSGLAGSFLGSPLAVDFILGAGRTTFCLGSFVECEDAIAFHLVKSACEAARRGVSRLMGGSGRILPLRSLFSDLESSSMIEYPLFDASWVCCFGI